MAWVILGVAVVSLWRERKASRSRLILLTVGFGLLMLANHPTMSHLALGSLEWSYPPLKRLPDDAGAIVVLSGGWELPDSVRLEYELGSDTLYRCIYAAELYRARPMPVIVSGGPVSPGSSGPSIAQLMRDFLTNLGVNPADLRIEGNSRSTFENAVECRKLLEVQGIRKVLLVTEATHMRRASLCFYKQGFEVVPAACHHIATDFAPTAINFLPSPGAGDGISDVWHEWFGLAWYRFLGRI